MSVNPAPLRDKPGYQLDKPATVRRHNQLISMRDPRVIIDLARNYTTKAIRTLAELMEDTAQPGPVRVRAAEILIERGYGKAPQAVLVTDDRSLPTGIAAVPIEERIKQLIAARDNAGSVTDLEASAVMDVEEAPANAPHEDDRPDPPERRGEDLI